MTTTRVSPQGAAIAPGTPDSAGGVQAQPPVGRPPISRPASQPPRRRGIGWGARAELMILIGPALIVFLAFVILPVGLAAYYGFFSWSGFGTPTDFVGFRNYVTILSDPAFHEALGHNLFILVMSLVLQGPIALVFALLLNRKLRFQSVIRVLIFVPYVISEVVVGIGWSLMLQTEGAFNGLLEKIGLTGLQADWLSDPALAIWTLMLIITWKYIGFAVILFLAGLQGIPDELSEAAAIDGASYWQVQRLIVLPLLGPTIRIWAFLSVIGSLQLFDLVWIIWGQYVSSTAGTSTMATYMVANGRGAGSFGYGSAVAVVLFLISLTIALIYQRFVLRRDTAGALTEKPDTTAEATP
ncbi:sugar ABC transporter permease [Microbacterium sp. LTA6]|uniref:carbohydrate ABC transporter permease n=1 Tax=unclassified Microbacterium TaxID=2609290 RepID=UPI003138E9A9